MEMVAIIGVDLAKRSFQVHGAAADGSVLFRKKLSRAQVLAFFVQQPNCTVAMEACATAHDWGRQIEALGHDVKLIPPIYVKPFVKRHKNDAADAEAIARILKEEIEEGKIQVESRRRNIIIRVEEKGSFSPGSAVLSEQFEQIMDKIRQALAATPGKITIEGHTDDIPINTDRFRSNWDLSSARAASVAYELELDELVTPDRMKVIGYADTKPLVPNDNRENRSKNRRVEIIVDQGFSEDTGTVSYLNEEKDKAEAEGNEVNVEIEERLFELKPDEVF